LRLISVVGHDGNETIRRGIQARSEISLPRIYFAIAAGPVSSEQRIIGK
jgi:hypothetical protein